MRNGFGVTVVAALAVVAIGVGVAAADKDYGIGQGVKEVDRAQELRKYKDLEQSEIALTAYLSGKAEVNAEGDDGAGDPGAKGAAMLFVKDRQTVCYGFAIRGAEAPVAAHVHRAPAGQNGDVVIDFSKGVPKDANGQPAGDPGTSSGCKTVAGAERTALGRILSKPKGYYLNIHTPSFPAGAVRGQLGRMYYDND